MANNQNNKIRVVEKPTMTFAEVDAPGGIVTRSGKRITGKVIVPDGKMGYGDQKSLALMAGDVVARVSTDSKAGDVAYESALEQADQDQALRRRKLMNMSKLSKNPAVKMFYNPESDIWDVSWVEEDDMGFISLHSKQMTDAQAGYMAEQHAEKEIKSHFNLFKDA